MRFLFQAFLLLAFLSSAHAQSPAVGKTWRYQLLEGSAIMNDCPICDRLSVWEPMHGSFDLKGTTNAQIFEIENVSFSSLENPAKYRVVGKGNLDQSKSTPEITLDVSIFLTDAGGKVLLINSAVAAPRIFPMLALEANEDTGSLTRVYRLRINAAPISEVWFSTEIGITDEISPGDLLSTVGSVVKSNQQLTEKLSLIEPADLSLDAVALGPRGEIFFSTGANAESFVNGIIGHGDILSASGRVYLQGSQLLASFGVSDAEAGLDAIHLKSEDEVYFSISTEVTRPAGLPLLRGDILSSKGTVFRTEAQLLRRFQDPLEHSIGIDSLYIWPNGEIWFSPETSFTSPTAGEIKASDILSDQGYVALRLPELLRNFNSNTISNDFGLDAVYIISDANASNAATQILEITSSDEGLDLRWDGLARAFQLEKAADIEGPWLPVGGVNVDRSARDSTPGSTAFYRLRQW